AEVTIFANVRAFNELVATLDVAKLKLTAKEEKIKEIRGKIGEAKKPWDALYADYLWAEDDPKEVQKVRKKLEQLQQDSKFKACLDEVAQYLEDDATRQKLVAVGVLIGIAIATWGVGVLVEGAVAGAAGVALATGAEALTFTTLSTLLLEKDPNLKDFMTD